MKAQAHTQYKILHEGKEIIVPSVTTVLGQLAKPALIPWANKLGLQGIDVAKYVDLTAEAGSLAHKMILDFFKKQKTDTSEYSKDVIEKAENAFLSFLEWSKGKKIEPIFVEYPMISKAYRYGGTIDFYGLVNGEKTLIDFKTGSGLYEEYAYQLAAYRNLIQIVGDKYVRRQTILRIPRTEDESFEIKEFYGVMYEEFEIFNHLLQIWWLKKELKEVKK